MITRRTRCLKLKLLQRSSNRLAAELLGRLETFDTVRVWRSKMACRIGPALEDDARSGERRGGAFRIFEVMRIISRNSEGGEELRNWAGHGK